MNPYRRILLKNPEEHNLKVKLFRWDNYVLNLDEVYENFFGKKYFITQKSYPGSEFITHEASIEEFINNFDFWIKDSKNGCIVNPNNQSNKRKKERKKEKENKEKLNYLPIQNLKN